MNKSRKLFLGGFILLIAIISIAITMQGWRSRITAFDLLPYFSNVRDFLAHGTLPQSGDIGSYGSFSPPGTSWLLLPGTILFRDTRLAEYLGASLLHITTLLGIYLLARSYFGPRCAALAVLLYGMGESALFFAGSLWPIGRPDFYIWIVYLTGKWAARRDIRYLAAALVVWGFGMYVDMAILPLFFIFPSVWIYFRLKLHPRPLILAGVFVLLIWFPFLRFDASRGFSDLRSQLFLQSIFPGNFRESWCNPTLLMSESKDGLSASQSSSVASDTPNLLIALFSLSRIDKENLLTNFEPDSPLRGVGYLLLLITLSSLLIYSIPGYSSKNSVPAHYSPSWRIWLKRIAIGWIFLGLFLISLILIYLLIFRNGTPPGQRISFVYKISIILLYCGISLLAIPWLAKKANDLLVKWNIHIQTSESVEHIRPLVLSLIIPWLILLLISEPDKPERFMWLWPLQSVFLAAFLIHVLPKVKLPRVAIWSIITIIALIVMLNPFFLSRINDWYKTGWAGQEADEIKVSNFIAGQLEADGRNQASIGYRVFFYPFMAEYNLISPTYKIGAEIDHILLFWHGITNVNQCAEGVADSDEYRIVEMNPEPWAWSPINYFDVPIDNSFRLVYQVSSYQVYQRH